MSWCDKLASTPTAGFKLDQRVLSGDALFQSLAPIVERHLADEKAGFSIEQIDAAGLQFNTESGFRYGFDYYRSFVAFNHRIRAVAVSGGPPVMEMLSHPLPFTELLPEVFDRLIEATLLIPNSKGRSLQRIGVVSTTSVSEDELPPGIVRMIDYFTRPWSGPVDNFSFVVSSELGSSESWTDSCIHTIVKPADTTQLMSLQFDWGRTFDGGKTITSESLKSLASAAQKASLEYLEELAEGVQFDERATSQSA